MKAIKYIIKKSKRQDGTTPIYIQYNYSRDKRTLLNTGKYTLPKYWDPIKCILKKSHPDYEAIFSHIESLRRKAEGIIDNAIIRSIDPSIDLVKSQFKTDISFQDKSKIKDFFVEMENFIEESKTRVTADVIKDYKSLKKHLTNFQKEKNIPISFNNINYNTYNKLREYLIYEAVKPDESKGLSINTVGKQIKNLKVFLRHCIRAGIIEFQDLSFLKVETEEVDSIYLNEEEILSIYNLDLSENSHLIKYRDLFIIGCETGLRFSDFSTLKAGNIKGDYIKKKVSKSHRQVVIPISNLLREVLNKYDNNPPDNITLQNFNDSIKTIGKLAELDEEIITVRKVGIKKVETTNKKHELISSHTCRRSFCTNQFNKGMPTLLIRKISGHKTERAFLKYIKIDEEEAAKKMLELWNS